MEKASTNRQYSEVWGVINDISDRKKKPLRGQVAGNSPKERTNTWFFHFKNLLGNAPPVDDPEEDIPDIIANLDIEDGPFTMEEYLHAKRSLKLGKCAGPDNIPPEVLKTCDLDDIILSFCNQVLMNGRKPDQWSLSNILPVPKSGNLSNTDNYRGIGLTCIIAKIFNSMILNRIRGPIDSHLRDNQNGFRKNRSTLSHILALRRILEEARKNNLSVVLTFIDFKKAFDSIHRGKMIKILKAYDIPPRLLRAINAMYSGTRSKVMTPDGDTEEFEITAGVLQGDTLAPFIFVIVLDYVLRKAISRRESEFGFMLTPRRSSRNPEKVITDLVFADDIALTSGNVDRAQRLLSRVENEGNRVGLLLSEKKTKVMTCNVAPDPILTNGGIALEEVEDFKYLGSWVNSSERDIKTRKALAWKALNSMKRVWKSNVSNELKTRLFIATVESVLLYGCESWTFTSALERSLDGCYTRMLRAALNISWQSFVPNEELYGTLPRISDKVAWRRLGLAGHCFRHKELLAGELVLWEPTHGRRGRGRPSATFIDTLKRDLGTDDKLELEVCMTNQEDWRARRAARLRPP